MTTRQANSYVTHDGETFLLGELPADEQQLIAELQSKAKSAAEWTEFRNWWMARVSEFYEPRGLTRREILGTAGYGVGQDLVSRKMIEQGVARAPEYRDELESIIHQRFKSRGEFCRATGLSEDLLSDVLSRRTRSPFDTLEESLRRIGYSIHIAPSVQG